MADLDERHRLELVRFLLSAEMAALPEATRGRALLAVLQSPEPPPSREELIAWLAEYGLPETQAVVERARSVECDNARRAHALRRAGNPLPETLAASLAQIPLDAPLDWAVPPRPDSRVGQALSLLADRVFLDRWPGGLPQAKRAVDAALRERWAALGEGAAPELLHDPLALVDGMLERADLPAELADALRQARDTLVARDRAEKESLGALADAGKPPPATRTALAVIAEKLRSLEGSGDRKPWLDALLTWPTPDAAPLLLTACADASAQQRAAVVLTLRFGLPFGTDWARWSGWLKSQAPVPVTTRLGELDLDPALPLLLLAVAPESPLAAPLTAWCASTGAVRPEHFLERWQERIPAAEALLIAGRAVPVPLPPTPEPEPEPEPEPRPESAPVTVPAIPVPVEVAPAEPPPSLVTPPPPVAPVVPAQPEPRPAAAARVTRPPTEPAGPDPWRGFLTENANLLAGIAMLLVGGSLVAYFTWDRHWLFRYTLVPGLFAAFTGGLAAVARWLQKADETLAGTATMLRGAAIALLPVNCMSVSLLADDPLVTHKLVAVPAMAALYVVLLTIGLRRWCGAVHPALRGALAPGLLFLNALVLIRPLARALARMDEFEVLDVLTVGFYAGFLVVAEVLRRFVSHVLTREMAREPRIAWFTGGMLAVTYLQVFVWAHAWERALPSPSLYGPLLVLAGGLAFFVERRFRLVLDLGGGAGEESFVGFTLILVGILAAFANPGLRIVCLLLAGLLWLYQARFRSSPLHDYLGLLLLVLGGASVALLPSFPRPVLGGLGLVISLGIGSAAMAAARLQAPRMRQAAHELQQALLVLTAVVSALTQWHFRSEPLWTAAALGTVVALHFARAARHDGARDALIAAMVAALALPYLGFADMRGQRFVGNTLVMGLALLSVAWLGAIRVAHSRLLLSLRSTVVFLYGALAVTAMAARVLVERQAIPSPSLAVSFPEFLGPLLMLAVLVWTTYLSRSMLPMLGGLLIVVAMLPALKANFQALFPALSWGTGYGSAVTALLLLVAAFYLRGAPGLQALGEGDLFFDQPFPLGRRDHALFTTPLLATVLFLLLRVDTFSVWRNLGQGPPLKTAAAVVLTAVTWTLLAIWWRTRPAGTMAVHAGMLFLLAGLVLAKRQWGDPRAFEWPLLLAGLVLQSAEAGYRQWLLPRHSWARALLADPTRAVLRGSAVLTSLGLAVALVAGHQAASLRLLTAFVLVQLVRHALREVALLDGSMAIGLFLTTLLAETAPGTGPLLDRLTWAHSVWSLLAFAALVQAAGAVLERLPAARVVAPVLRPARAASAALTWGFGLAALVTAISGPRLELAQLVLLVASALLLAHTRLPGPTLLLAALVAYTAALHAPLVAAHSPEARGRLLFAPVPLASFALLMTLVVSLARRTLARVDQAVVRWLLLPAAGLAVVATLRHTVVARGIGAELPAPYLAALALGLAALELRMVSLGWLSATAVTLGNVHGVRLALGELLRERGLSDVHLLALGSAATLIQATALRWLLRERGAAQLLRQVMLAAAGLVLVLLSGNYASDPDLEAITPLRFLVSGAMALGAGLFFRRAATAPEPDEEAHVGVAYAVYHFGAAMALWCLVLLVPVFRHPVAALPGLAVPAAYFLAVAEYFRRRGDPRAFRYARSSAVVAAAVLALYAARPIFQMLMFPEAVVRTDHYHSNAPLVVLLGLALLRLHAFEKRAAAAYLGGTALMVGAWFGLTAWPGLSPFDNRFPAAWSAVALAHLLGWVIRRRNLARAWVQRLGDIDDAAWERLALAWHLTAFAGALDVAMIAVSHEEVGRYGWGALLGGVASILLQREWQRPAIAGVTGVLLSIGLVEAAFLPSLLSELALLAIAAGVARVAPGPFALIAAFDGYLLAQHRELAALSDPLARWAVLTAPWRAAALSLGLALLVERERRAEREPAAPPAVRLLPWLGSSAALVGLLAALAHSLDPALRQQSTHLWAPYLAAAAHALLALSPGASALAWSAAGLLALGSVHALHHWVGAALAAHGVFRLEEIALGVALMLAATAPLRGQERKGDALRRLTDVRCAFALGTLALLAASYVWQGAVPTYGTWRGVLTGLIALVAAEAIRARARRDGAPRPLTPLYHLAASAALLGFALAVPLLRTPDFALATLAIPAVFLWARTELSQDDRAAGYRTSAIAAAAVVLACWLSRALFAAVLFPGLAVTTRHYHTHAAVALVLGFLLLRLHQRGAPYAVAVSGALAVVAGSYFAITAWPGLSPFTDPLRGAWAAIVIVHLWTLATSEGSSVTALVRDFSGLREEAWHRLRATAGESALFAAHLLTVSAIAHPTVDSHAIAPLLCGAASLLVHHGLLRARGAYFDVAAVELLAALHVDALAPSYLRLQHVVWVLLAVRALLVLGAARRLPDPVRLRAARWGTVCALLVVAHVLHQRPWTTVGLFATVLLAVVTALVPRATSAAHTLGDRLVVGLLLAVPTWLVQFASAPWAEDGPWALVATEPLLLTLIAVLLTGLATRTLPAWGGAEPTGRPRALHQVWAFLLTSGEGVHTAALYAVSAAAGVLLLVHYGQAYAPREFVLLLALLGGLAASWYRRGRGHAAWAEVLLAEVFAGAAFGVLRRQLLLTTSLWSYEYDLWLSLAASALFTGAKQRLDRRQGSPELQRPLTLSVLVMPALALVWTLTHHLGSDMLLLVVGLNAVLFAFLGHDRRDSPYNLVAVSGFVSFVLIVFWSKLDLHVVHAYVVPVGIGVLLLAQMFEAEIPAGARTHIRVAALGSMLASTGYSAILDGRHPLAFNLTLLLLCLAAMAVGSLLRIRLYVALGLSTLLLDLVSLAVKALARMESQARMTWVGLTVFLLGAAIVAAAVYHKARRREIEEWWSRLRGTLARWQ